MSNCVINIRLIFWHLKRTIDGDWSVSFNGYLWAHRKFAAFIFFIQFCDFDLSFLVDKIKPPSILFIVALLVTAPLWVSWILVGSICFFHLIRG